MLHQITWSQFIIAVLVLMAIYYVSVILLFYRRELFSFLSGIKANRKEPLPTEPAKSVPENTLQVGPKDYDQLERIISEVEAVILQHEAPERSKEVLLGSLSETLRGYQGLQVPAFRKAINNRITKIASEHCGVVLTELELNDTWKAFS